MPFMVELYSKNRRTQAVLSTTSLTMLAAFGRERHQYFAAFSSPVIWTLDRFR